MEKEDARSDFETEFKKSFYRRPNTEELAGGAPIHVFANNAYVKQHLILFAPVMCRFVWKQEDKANTPT